MTSKVVEVKLDEGIVNNDVWVDCWAIGDTGFHQPKSDPFLDAKDADIFEGKTKSVFLPLCGKSLDMLWMYNKGHTVCGVEIAEQPIREFFEEHNIEKEIEQIENIGTLYKSTDGRVKLYVADLYNMSPSLCGQFDVIFDSKSLVAINVADQQLYRDVLLALMKPDGLYYVETLEYDPSVWPGPPHSVTDKNFRDLYGVKGSIEMVEENGRNEVNPNVPKDAPKPSQGSEEKPYFGGVGAALSSSSYFYTRWYKFEFK